MSKMTREEVVKEFMNEGPAELSVEVDEAGNVGMKLRGDVFKLGWMVAKAADGIFSEIGDAHTVEGLDRAITETIHVMMAHRIAQIKKTDTPFDLKVEMSTSPFDLKDIIKTILGKG